MNRTDASSTFDGIARPSIEPKHLIGTSTPLPILLLHAAISSETIGGNFPLSAAYESNGLCIPNTLLS